MKAVWKLTIDDYFEIVKRAKEDGVKPGESIEKHLIAYMQEKGVKPSGHTELTKKEMLKEYGSHGNNVLNVDVDDSGKSSYQIHKRNDDV